jgi:SAM-dependent methyltransferase
MTDTDGQVPLISGVDVDICAVCESSHSSPAWKARDTLMGSTDEYSFVRCDSCGTIRMSPRPLFEARRQSFSDDYPLFDWALGRKQADAEERINRFQVQIGQINHRQRPGRLLDVGCGDGYFMLGMQQRGWDVQGIELNENVAAFAREQLKLDVTAGAENEVDWNGPYDCITLLGVIEDVDDPNELLSRCYGYLADGGLLVVQTHNIASWEARYFKGDWFNVEAPRHVWHFDPGTLQRLIENNRFNQTDLIHYGAEYVTERSIENRRGRKFPSSALDRALRKAVIAPAARVLPRIGQGIMIESYCRKKTV